MRVTASHVLCVPLFVLSPVAPSLANLISIDEPISKFWLSVPEFGPPLMTTSLGAPSGMSLVDLVNVYVSCFPSDPSVFRVNALISSRSSQLLGQNPIFYFGTKDRGNTGGGIPVEIQDQSEIGIASAFSLDNLVEATATVVRVFDEYNVHDPQVYLESLVDADFFQGLAEADRLLIVTQMQDSGGWSAIVDGRIDFQRDQASQFLAACLGTNE